MERLISKIQKFADRKRFVFHGYSRNVIIHTEVYSDIFENKKNH